jgi:hypothetical protein
LSRIIQPLVFRSHGESPLGYFRSSLPIRFPAVQRQGG